MALREVLQFPDRRLRQISKPLEDVSEAIRLLASDMLEVMYDEPGIGLAAPQVGVAVRLVVMDTKWTERSSGTKDVSRYPTSRPTWNAPHG
jgi:peptide deformylase